ncbi:TolC family protein [Planctellipticum variicoloris]|uniref:TolC family protein n=1 Tax=Planctellipticum variicoloris TaxID=3064265 RepID=UPI003013AE80|nr:TolC family protein [Planctomycetaceae bacterium SH412]
MSHHAGWILVLALLSCGCAVSRVPLRDATSHAAHKPAADVDEPLTERRSPAASRSSPEIASSVIRKPAEVRRPANKTRETSIEIPAEESADGIDLASADEPAPADLPPAPDGGPAETLEDDQPALALDHVIDAIYSSFPLLRVALYERNIAQGQYVTAQGEFDTKLKADSANTPMGFYQTYRQSLGVEQPLFGGGSVFGGYRIGRGYYSTWDGGYQTNDGGEFKAGLAVPLWQNRTIDDRRMQLWVTAVGQNVVEPQIKIQLLNFVRDGSVAYWDWVAAGLQYRIATQLFELANDRQQKIEAQVQSGKEPESDLTDNGRLIVARQVKLLDAERKLHVSAAKLSLFFRGPDGTPLVPPDDLLPPDFPLPLPIEAGLIEQDIAYAVTRRPEFGDLDLQRQQLEFELSQAQNLMLPQLDAQLMTGKDVGAWSSPSGNKTPFQLDGGVTFTMPVQFRKARGKLQSLEGKLAQNTAKRQFTQDKIGVEVRSAIVAIDTAYRAIGQAREAVRLNQQMQDFEAIRFEEGASDLLRINLREQATFDARVAEVEAVQRYFTAQAEYRAAVAADLPDVVEMTDP